MIDPASMADWAQASFLVTLLGGLAAACGWVLRQEQRERLLEARSTARAAGTPVSAGSAVGRGGAAGRPRRPFRWEQSRWSLPRQGPEGDLGEGEVGVASAGVDRRHAQRDLAGQAEITIEPLGRGGVGEGRPQRAGVGGDEDSPDAAVGGTELGGLGVAVHQTDADQVHGTGKPVGQGLADSAAGHRAVVVPGGTAVAVQRVADRVGHAIGWRQLAGRAGRDRARVHLDRGRSRLDRGGSGCRTGGRSGRGQPAVRPERRGQHHGCHRSHGGHAQEDERAPPPPRRAWRPGRRQGFLLGLQQGAAALAEQPARRVRLQACRTREARWRAGHAWSCTWTGASVNTVLVSRPRSAELVAGLAHRGQGDGGRGGEVDVVVADDRQVARDAELAAGHLLEQAQREQVVGAESRGGPAAGRHGGDVGARGQSRGEVERRGLDHGQRGGRQAGVQQRQVAIVISADDPNAVVPALKAAMAQGIKVVTYDADTAPEGRTVFVNQASPEAIGRSEVQVLGKQLNYTGQIAILSATSTAANQNTWIRFMKDELSKPQYSKMKLVKVAYGNDDDQTSFQQAQGLLQAYPDLKGIISPTTVGVSAAARYLSGSSFKGKVALTGLGTPNQMRKFVKDGTVASFELWDPGKLGYLAAYAAAALASGQITGKEGETFKAGNLGTKSIGADGEILLGPPQVFDKSNIDQFDF